MSIARSNQIVAPAAPLLALESCTLGPATLVDLAGGVLVVHVALLTRTTPARPASVSAVQLGQVVAYRLGDGGRSLAVLAAEPFEAEPPGLLLRIGLPEQPSPGRTTTLVLELRTPAGRAGSRTPSRTCLSLDSDAFNAALADAPAAERGPHIDYMARDYASFRRLIMEHLTQAVPQWDEHHAADMGVMLAEVLAHSADYLSYYQDAVATEAYLETARRRTSVRRHVRLLDYPMHEGCNARVWVQIRVSADGVGLPRGTPLLVEDDPTGQRLPTNAYQPAARQWLHTFETMHPAVLHQAHNRMAIYTWGFDHYTLEAGCTQAALWGHLPNLRVGDVLIVEQVRNLAGSPDLAPSQHHRYALRLCEPALLDTDEIQAEPITRIRWAAADALPDPCIVAGVTPAGHWHRDCWVVRGNMVLADAGRSVTDELLPEAQPPRPFRPLLRERRLVYATPYDHTLACRQPASVALPQDPHQALPAIRLTEQFPEAGALWWPQRDLGSSGRFGRVFVAESESDGTCRLRFGDGWQSRSPSAGARFRASYRVHHGPDDNVGPEMITSIVSDDGRISAVCNLLPASGAQRPEPLAQVRLLAPAGCNQRGSPVTADDYAALVCQHPQVSRAVVRFGQEGLQPLLQIWVDRVGHQAFDAPFLAELAALLEPHRQLGQLIVIKPPRLVSLELGLTARLRPGASRQSLGLALRQALGAARLPDGQTGLFHPDNFSFGQPVYASRVVERAMQVPGVLDVQLTTLQRWHMPSQGALAAGVLTVGPLEIARLEEDLAKPQHGQLQIQLEGGL